MKGVAAVFSELDAATVVEGRLLAGWVKVRVEALRVGVPDVQDGPLDWLAMGPAYEAGHAQSFDVVRVAREIDVSLDQRRALDVERPFDGARRAAGAASGSVLGVHLKVKEMLEADAGRDQTKLAGAVLQKFDGLSELALRDIVLLYNGHRGLQEVAGDGFEARIAAALAKAAGAVEQALHR